MQWTGRLRGPTLSLSGKGNSAHFDAVFLIVKNDDEMTHRDVIYVGIVYVNHTVPSLRLPKSLAPAASVLQFLQ